MLTSCPKCGFSQPKDQYCARCGVDMTAYRPPEKSMLQKLSESLFVQLLMVAVIGIFAVSFVTRNQKESFWSRVQFLRGSTTTQVARSQDGNNFAAAQAVSENPEQTEVASSTETAAPAAKVAPALPNQAQIYYLEIPPAVLSKWLEDNVLTRVETSGDVTIGYIPNFEQTLELYKAQVKVMKEEKFNYNLNQLYTSKMDKPANPNATLNSGRTLANTNEETAAQTQAAYVTYATLDDDRNDTLMGQLEVSTNPQTSFPAHFEMPREHAFFISGFSRQRSQPQDRSLVPETVVVFRIDK